mgnify:CR=1 FL=1
MVFVNIRSLQGLAIKKIKDEKSRDWVINRLLHFDFDDVFCC